MSQIKKNPCQNYHCYRCCTNTNMLLTNNDIHIIQQQGYDKEFFVQHHNGWFQLKNKDNHCVFHTKTHCIIYPYRPQGCRLYPIVYQNDDATAIYDHECPHPNYFSLTADIKNQLFDLVHILKKEKTQRTKQ